MKKLLMLGGGFLQNFVIKKARQLGYYVYCVDADPNALGFAEANEHAVINITDQEGCCAYAREKGVDGVLTAATDFSVLTMSYVARELGLPGVNYETAKTIKNKAATRRCLYDAKADDTGYSYMIESLDQIPEILPKIVFPIMMKPVDGSGSRGASKVEKPEDFKKACEYAMSGSISHRAVAEPFVEGKEYGVESFVDNGEIHVLAVMQKDMTLPPYYAELGHAIPSGLPVEVDDRIRQCVTIALKALKVNQGAVNMDILVTEDYSVHIVDIGARMGGNLICSHVVPTGTGIDYMGNVIKAAVGDKPDWGQVTMPEPVATKLLALQPGTVKSLPDFENLEEEYGVRIEHHLHIGDIITPYRTNLDGCGYVVAKAIDVDSAIGRAAVVKNIIDKTIERA